MAPIATRRRPAAGSQAALALLQPHVTQKNPHVCVLNLTGSVSGHRAFTNPQVDSLQDFRLLPLAELKRKRTSFLRAGRSESARSSPSQAQMPAPSTTLPSTCSSQPTTLPSACDIQPIAPKRLQALASAPQAPSDSIPPYVSHPPFATQRASLHTWFPTQLHAMQPGSAQFSTQRPERLRHPAHRAPSVCSIRLTVCHTTRVLAHVVSHAVVCDAT